MTAAIGLVLATASIGFGGFAYRYWRHFPGDPGPPYPTYVATHIGFILAVLSAPLSVSAESRVRASLMICSLGLLGFYFLMYRSP